MPGFIACVCFIAEISSAAYVQLHSLHFYQFFFMRDWISACPNNAFSAHVWIQSFATLDSSPVLYVLTTCISIMFFFWLIISDTLSSFCICASHIDFGTASLDSSHNLAESSPHFFSAPGALVIVGGRESDLALAGTAELAATLRHSWRWSLVVLIYPEFQTWTRPCAFIESLNIMVMVVAMVTELPDADVFFSPHLSWHAHGRTT
jgi:hypothetical protein